ncbi:MAG: 5'/3'-nucleotidase SurE [Candidatus Eisenbacteria bacterium]|nr:5'/3'-nucleotidase SurE [Candidatus Eisenbacteria bacterium]
MSRMRILVTNDDGIRAAGIAALQAALRPLGEVWVVAPDREQSASSHALTLSDPLRIQPIGERMFSVSGTPTDCVLLAIRGVRGVMEPRPDLVVSGINHGPNMGDDVTYSGTVAAAVEGSLLGCPAIAFSNTAWSPQHLDASAEVARRIVAQAQARPLSDRMLLNVNIPDRDSGEIRGLRATHLGQRVYRDEIIAKTDPRGKAYYWIGGDPPVWAPDETSDFAATSDGYVSVTPLRVDWTDGGAVEGVRDWLGQRSDASVPAPE